MFLSIAESSYSDIETMDVFAILDALASCAKLPVGKEVLARNFRELHLKQGQGDQMSLWKNRPKCSQTHFR
jgi:hypothetical protein